MRNNNIDCLRAICAAEVVFTHFCFVRSGLVDLRYAVPVFFMISGFFLYSPDCDTVCQRAVKAAKKITKILLWATAAYAAYKVYFVFRHGETLFNAWTLRDVILLNFNPFGGHLWYLQAYIYILGILWVTGKMKRLHLLRWTIVPLLVVFLAFEKNCVIGKLCMPLLGREFYSMYTYNFLFCGLPFVTLGMLLREKYTAISQIRWLRRWSLWIFALGLVVYIAEKYWLMSHYEDFNGIGGRYVGTIVMALALMAWALTHPSDRETWLSRIGRDYSLQVYVWHKIVGWLIPMVLFHLPHYEVTGPIFNFVAAPIVIVATLACIWLYRRARQCVTRR